LVRCGPRAEDALATGATLRLLVPAHDIALTTADL